MYSKFISLKSSINSSSISSKIGNDINEQSNASKGLKSRHRKMASSYFLGSYISGDELHKFMQEYKGVNKDNRNNNKNNKNDNGINEEIYVEGK